MKAVLKIVKAVDWFSMTVGRTISVGIPVLILVIAFEIVMRSFFKTSTHWSYDISIFIYGYTGLLAGAWVMKEGQHINVDILQAKLSPRGRAVTDVVSALIIIFFLIIMIKSGTSLALAAFKMHQKSPSLWGAPIAHFKAVIPVAAAMVLIQTLANLVRHLHLAVTGRPLEPRDDDQAEAAGPPAA